MIRTFSSEIAKRELGVHWVDRYIKEYHVDLISKWATSIDRSRHRDDSQAKYSLYFNLLRDKINQHNVKPHHMYNMDKRGFNARRSYEIKVSI